MYRRVVVRDTSLLQVGSWVRLCPPLVLDTQLPVRTVLGTENCL